MCRSTYGVMPRGSPDCPTAGCQNRCRQLESRTIDLSVAEKIGVDGDVPFDMHLQVFEHRSGTWTSRA